MSSKIRPILITMGFLITIVILLFAYDYYVDIDLPDLPLAPGSFDVPYDKSGTHTLGVGWQMISMPRNLNKTDIHINYQEETYTWNEAVIEGYIGNVIFIFDSGNYIETNSLLKTRGYWMYCFVDGISISDYGFVVYCGKLIQNSSAQNITCDKVVIAPEFYDNTVEYNTFIATDMYEFYYLGGDVLE